MVKKALGCCLLVYLKLPFQMVCSLEMKVSDIYHENIMRIYLSRYRIYHYTLCIIDHIYNMSKVSSEPDSLHLSVSRGTGKE